MQLPVTLNSSVSAVKDQTSCNLADEVAILQVSSGQYFGLDPVGAFIWNHIQAPQKVSGVITSLTEEYDVDHKTAEHDVLNLLQELAAVSLIEVQNESTS